MRIIHDAPGEHPPVLASLPGTENQREARIDTCPTVAEIVKLYLAHAEAQHRHSQEARSMRVRILEQFVRAYGHYPCCDLKQHFLTDFIAAHSSWRAPSTKKAVAVGVNACFAWACDEERIARNPFRRVRYKASNRRPDMPDEIFERICKLANKPTENAFRFLRLTGRRLNELCSARWCDVDLERGLWVIPKTKSGKPQVVALVAEAIDLLRGLAELRAVAPPAKEALSPNVVIAAQVATDAHRVIFLNTHGTAWNRRTLGQQLARIKRRHGIQCAATLHGTRHRWGTAAVAAGASIKLVSQALGHSSVVITEQYYVDPAGLVEATRSVAEMACAKAPSQLKRSQPADGKIAGDVGW